MTSLTLLLRVKSYFCYPSKNLSAIFADSKQSKPPFGETLWLMGHHATPLVTLFFIITMLLTGHHAMPVVILWFTASASDLRDRFLLSGVFYLTLLSRSPWGRQFNLKVSRASYWPSKYSPGPIICLNHNNPQKGL